MKNTSKVRGFAIVDLLALIAALIVGGFFLWAMLVVVVGAIIKVLSIVVPFLLFIGFLQAFSRAG